jgi:hypothetical protein
MLNGAGTQEQDSKNEEKRHDAEMLWNMQRKRPSWYLSNF